MSTSNISGPFNSIRNQTDYYQRTNSQLNSACSQNSETESAEPLTEKEEESQRQLAALKKNQDNLLLEATIRKRIRESKEPQESPPEKKQKNTPSAPNDHAFLTRFPKVTDLFSHSLPQIVEIVIEATETNATFFFPLSLLTKYSPIYQKIYSGNANFSEAQTKRHIWKKDANEYLLARAAGIVLLTIYYLEKSLTQEHFQDEMDQILQSPDLEQILQDVALLVEMYMMHEVQKTFFNSCRSLFETKSYPALEERLRHLEISDAHISNMKAGIKYNAFIPCMKAKVLLTMQEYPKALETLRSILEANPANDFALALRGWLYYRQDNLDKALECFLKACEMNCNNEQALLGQAQIFIKQKKFDQALECLDKVLQLNPKFEEASLVYKTTSAFKEGITCFKAHDYDAATKHFHRAIDLNPENAYALVAIGEICRVKGQLTDALESFGKALDIDPKNHTAWETRGHLHLLNNNLNQAIEDLSQAIRINPNYHSTFVLRANARLLNNNLHQAIEDLSRAIKMNPNYHEVYNLVRNAHCLRNDLQVAITVLSKTIASNPQERRALILRGIAFYWQQQFDLAFKDFNAAIQLESRDATTLALRGDTLLRGRIPLQLPLHYTTAAEIDVSAALSLNPQELRALNTRALIRFEKGDLAGALKDVNTVIETQVDPAKPNRFILSLQADALALRSHIHRMHGYYNSAKEDLEKSITINPDSIFAYNALHLTLNHSEEKELLVDTFDRFIFKFNLTVPYQHNQWVFYVMIGTYCLHEKEPELAHKYFAQALTLNPNLPAIRSKLEDLQKRGWASS